MKNAVFSLLVGGVATSLIATESPIPDPTFDIKPEVRSHHEINPAIKVLGHKEKLYDYTKVIGGIAYNYYRSEGLNFGAFMGYSHSNSKSFFLADWNVKYIFNVEDKYIVYPVVGVSNTSNFSTNTAGESYQVYCGKLNVGLCAVYAYEDIATFDFGLHYFKDVTSSVILYKGDDFWGRVYSNPYGFKTTLDVTIPNIISKDIVVGGFYAQTIKTAYKEYGLNLAVNFAF